MTRLIHGMVIGAWVMIAFNLLVAFGAIGVFARMAPAIRIILEQNDRSLDASEEMLAALALLGSENIAHEELLGHFEQAFDAASANITEPEESDILEDIEENYRAAFSGNGFAREETVSAIRSLTAVNRAAMARADHRAEQLGRAGGWSVALMAGIAFAVSLALLRALRLRLIRPLEEIHDAVTSYNAGDTQRRCCPASAARELRAICGSINAVLDRDAAARARSDWSLDFAASGENQQ